MGEGQYGVGVVKRCLSLGQDTQRSERGRFMTKGSDERYLTLITIYWTRFNSIICLYVLSMKNVLK